MTGGGDGDPGERRQPKRSSSPVLQFRPRKRKRASAADDGPAALADLMLPTLTRMGLKTRARQVQLMNLWPGVVGDVVAEHTVVAAFNRGRLTIETDTPAMGHALHLQKQQIVDGLNHQLGHEVVTDIRFRMAGEKT
jgi:predicted nucleic acid-binding Zn ribbon protein